MRMILRGGGFANARLVAALPMWLVRCFLHLLRSPADAVMAIDLDTGLPAAVARLITGKPYIYNVRDNFSMRKAIPPVLRPVVERLDYWVMRNAFSVIVPDESRIPDTVEGGTRFLVIRNCALDVPVPAVPLGEREFTVYVMGYLRESRGVGLLLDALAGLPDVRVLTAGFCPEPSLRTRLQTTPRVDYRGELPVEEALRLCGESDVVFTFYAPDAEINIRAISNKWSDAMLAAKPILVNSEVLKSTWILTEDIGYACPYGDVDALVDVIKLIQAEPEDARRKGENGRKLFEAGYNWPAMESRIARELQDLAVAVQRHRPAPTTVGTPSRSSDGEAG